MPTQQPTNGNVIPVDDIRDQGPRDTEMEGVKIRLPQFRNAARAVRGVTVRQDDIFSDITEKSKRKRHEEVGCQPYGEGDPEAGGY